MSKRILFLVLATLFTIEFYQISSYFPIKADSSPRENVLAKIVSQRHVIDEGPSVKGVYVKYDDDVRYLLVRANTPRDALEILGYRVGDGIEMKSSSRSEELLDNSIIIVQTYRTEIVEKEIVMPFETISHEDSLCPRLSKKVVEQEGETGLMTQKIKRVYLEGKLVQETVIEEEVLKQPVKEIVKYEGANHSPTSVTNLGPNCGYWESAINSLNATEEEKRWLKFAMVKESGCNAENNKAFYKGLFQWSPCLWYTSYPNDNIFDGNAQIRRSLQKIRECADPAKMWPNVYEQYLNHLKSIGVEIERTPCHYI